MLVDLWRWSVTSCSTGARSPCLLPHTESQLTIHSSWPPKQHPSFMTLEVEYYIFLLCLEIRGRNTIWNYVFSIRFIYNPLLWLYQPVVFDYILIKDQVKKAFISQTSNYMLTMLMWPVCAITTMVALWLSSDLLVYLKHLCILFHNRKLHNSVAVCVGRALMETRIAVSVWVLRENWTLADDYQSFRIKTHTPV